MKMEFTYITIDDERATHLILDHFLKEIPSLIKLDQFSDPKLALQFINAHPCDLLFLDIDMPYLNGFELLQQMERKPLVIMITAHAQKYALNGYQYIDKGVIDFLEKPVEKERLQLAINRFLKFHQERDSKVDVAEILGISNNEMLQVQKRDKWVSIPVSNVKYLTVNGNYVYIFTSEMENYTKYISLEEILKQLPQETFIQVNRQQVVNILHIENYSNEILNLGKTEKEEPIIIPISSRRRKEVVEQIKKVKKALS